MAEKKINGSVYRYDKMPAIEGFRMLLQLLKIAGKAESLIKTFFSGDKKTDEMDFASALVQYLKDFNEDEVFQFVINMVERCKVDGDEIVLGVKPQDTMEMLEVAAFAIQTEFSGFFGGGAGNGILKTMMTAPR